MDEFIGIIKLFAGNFAPQGWAFCDGSLLNTHQYQVAFSLLGTTYGGDGTTTFGLPDLRGRVPVGTGIGKGLTNRTLGQMSGVESVKLIDTQLPAHNHQLLASDAAANESDPTGAALAQTIDAGLMLTTAIYTKAVPTVPMHGSSIEATGGSQAHENMPPYLGLNYIICLEGIYPSRA